MLQTNQISHFAGLTQAGAVEIVNADEVFDTKLVRQGSTDYSFTLAAAVDNHTLIAGEFNASDALFLDGSSQKSLNNGTAASTVAALGANSLSGLVLGSGLANMVTVLNSQHDEILDTDGAEVRAFLQTTKLDGVVPAASELQLSFVVYDDATSAFVPYSLPAGTYQYRENKVLSLAYAAKTGLLGSLLSNQAQGSFSREEILNLVAASSSKSYINFKLTANYTLPDYVINISNDGAATTITDSAATAIVATATDDNLKQFVQTIAGTTGLAYVDGLTVYINGVEVPASKAVYTSATNLAITLDENIANKLLIQGTSVELVF